MITLTTPMTMMMIDGDHIISTSHTEQIIGF
jgi:hypothetical protein